MPHQSKSLDSTVDVFLIRFLMMKFDFFAGVFLKIDMGKCWVEQHLLRFIFVYLLEQLRS